MMMANDLKFAEKTEQTLAKEPADPKETKDLAWQESNANNNQKQILLA